MDGFGAGTSIAFPPSVDISMDIVEIRRGDQWVPVSKRGKLPGMKQLYRRRPGLNDVVRPWGEPGPKGYRPMLSKIVEKGQLLMDLPGIEEIRSYVLEQLAELPEPEPA